MAGLPDRIGPRRGARRKPPLGFSTGMAMVAGFVGLSLLGSCTVPWRSSDLAAQIAAARTPADHAAIARILLAQAGEYASKAAYHRSLAAKYEQLAGPAAQYRSYDRSDLRMAEHCRKVAEDLERAASDLTALAHEHQRLAGSLQGKEQ